MNKESKTEILLQMMEQPGQYTEQQWHNILSDEECRELYSMMALTQGSLHAARTDAALTEKEIEEELGRMKNERVKNEKFKLLGKFKLLFSYRKIAAIFLAAVCLGGLAWASIRILAPLSSPEGDMLLGQKGIEAPSGAVGEASPIRFSDIRLDSILNVVATHYGKTVCFRDTAAQALRLSTMWDREDSLAVFIATLNEFDGLLLKEEKDTVFVATETEEAK